MYGLMLAGLGLFGLMRKGRSTEISERASFVPAAGLVVTERALLLTRYQQRLPLNHRRMLTSIASARVSPGSRRIGHGLRYFTLAGACARYGLLMLASARVSSGAI